MANPNTRRSFLKNVGCGLLAAPLIGPIGNLALAGDNSTVKHTSQVAVPKVQLNIMDFGAVADGKTKNTAVIQQCIDRCGVLGGGEVVVPKGEYLTGAIALRSDTTLHLEEGAVLMGSPDFNDYVITQVRWEGKWIQGYSGLVYAIGANNIAITGKGQIKGNYALSGRPTADKPLRHPALIEPINCTNINFDGFSTDYHSMWSIHLTYCDHVSIKNLTIRSTGGNGDGIDVDSCKHVAIDNCDIATGDDCISLKSGRGMEGFTLLRTTEDVTITNCTFAGLIFACIGIGSEASGGIRDVRIEHCKFTEAKTFALYMKSHVGRGAFIENITANDLEVSNTSGGFLRFNITGSGLQDQNPVPGLIGIPTTKNFKFTNIRVKDVPVLVDGTGVHPDKPLEGLTLANISGTCKKGISLANVKNAVISNITVTKFEGALLNISNVQGKGLDGAAPLTVKPFTETVPAPATPYVLR